ncbi:MAG: ComEC/Rec2 family competence protein, partial [Gemmatimonadota bacterium]|nr:ComEC/Rec2 family competence protein [Gemmatimonadota bacterium]
MRSPGAAAVLAIAASVVLAGVVGPGTASWRRSSVGWACLSIGFLLATWNGGMARRDATGACANSLRTGDPVSLSGLVTNRVRTGANARPILRLTDVEIRAGTRTCRAVSGLVRLAGGEDAPASGMRVRSHGEWVRRGEDTGWPRAPDRLGLVAGAEIDEVWYGGGSPAVRLRSTLAGRLAGRLPADVAPIGLALILAERDELDAETRRRFADAGLAHFLAISGMHVGLLATAALWLLGQFLGRRRRGITLCLIAAYVLMIGAPVAARRALLVFAGFLWTRTRGWPTRSGDLLGAAGIVTLIHDPLSLSDPGFQLSFAGFAGVLVGARLSGLACAGTATGWRAERGRALGRAVVISTCALLSTSPFTAWHFGQITPVAAVSHLVGAPLVAVALGSLVATMTLPELFSLPAAAVATGAIRLLQAAVDRLAVLPFGHATVSAPGAIVWATWMLVVLAIYRVVARGDARAAIGPALLAMAVIAVAPVYRQPGTEDTLLCTLSVGQGDAAVLRTRRGHWMVFDGGPTGPTWDAGRAVLIPFLRRHGASRVDVALLSHPDTDHLGGLASLVEEMTVRRVLDTGEAVPSRAYERFLAAVDESGAQWLPAA